MRQVDLSIGTRGIVGFANGVRFWTPVVADECNGEYSIRWEHGWYKTYGRDGSGRSGGYTMDHTTGEVKYSIPTDDCIEFIPCEYDDPRAAGLKGEAIP